MITTQKVYLFKNTTSCQFHKFARSLFWTSPAIYTSFHRSFTVSSMMTKRKIPDRWEDYEPVGKVIEGTRFIAFKVPLNESLSRFLPGHVKRFTPQDLPATVKERNLDLGLVIDLTNTTRYYTKEDIISQGIQYEKIFTEGHSVPSEEVQNKFFAAVDDFLLTNENNDHVIGVHCTHGLNRTGYLVCRYMIDKMNFKADDAIKAFNEARGHDIERKNYLSDLRGEASAELFESDNRSPAGRKRTAPSDFTDDDHRNKKERLSDQLPTTDTAESYDTYVQNNQRRTGNNYYSHQQDRYRDGYHRQHSGHSFRNQHESEQWKDHEDKRYDDQRHDYNNHHCRNAWPAPSYDRRGFDSRRYDHRNYNSHQHDFTSDYEAMSSRHIYPRYNNYQSHNQQNWSGSGWYSSDQSDYGNFGRRTYRPDRQTNYNRYKGKP